MARRRRNVAVVERPVEEVLETLRERRKVRFEKKRAEAAAPAKSSKKDKTRDVNEAAVAALRGAQAHTITLALPSGEIMEIPGYASRRAANIDAKVMVLRMKKAIQKSTKKKAKVFTESDASLKQYRRSSPSRVKRKVVAGDRGYAFATSGRQQYSASAVVNPRHVRHNTHLAVGTKVDYKGKAAKVVKQHPKDKYTIRFDATGAEMISPGFILKRR